MLVRNERNVEMTLRLSLNCVEIQFPTCDFPHEGDTWFVRGLGEMTDGHNTREVWKCTAGRLGGPTCDVWWVLRDGFRIGDSGLNISNKTLSLQKYYIYFLK